LKGLRERGRKTMREIAIELADCSETEIAKKRAERREEKKNFAEFI
jgi:hypothetical protein